MKRFEVRLNGPFAVLDHRPNNITPSSEKGKALLLLLAMAGKQGRSRSWLQSMLWPGASSAANLRNELSVLRRHFGKFGGNPIKSNKKMVFLDDAFCCVGFSSSHGEERKLELAEGLDVDVPEFNEWLSQERRHWANSGERNADATFADLSNKALPSRKGVPMLYVSPIESASLSNRQTLLVCGLYEELLTSLGSLIKLVDVTTTEPQKKSSGTFKIEISIRGEDTPRITTRLVSLFSNRIMWTGRFDLEHEQIFDAQEKIARNVIETFQERLSDGAWANIWKQTNTNIEAWEALQRGRQHEASFDERSNLKAIVEYEQALKCDPNFFPAAIAKGFCLADQIRLGWSFDSAENLKEIENVVDSVLNSKPEDFYALSLRAFAVFLGGDKDKGLQLLEDVVRSNPSSPEMTAYLGAMLGHIGKIEEEIAKYRLSLALTSYPPAWIISNLAIAQATINDPETSNTADLALQHSPNSVRARIAKICSLVCQGREQDAQVYAKEILTIEPNFNAKLWSQKDSFARPQDYEHIATQLGIAGL